MSESLGKQVSVHTVAPAAVLRVVVVAALSFIFFLGTLVAFYASGRGVFFLLSTGFLVIYALTMIGWFALKRIELKIFEGGLTYRKASLAWERIESLERVPRKGLRLTATGRSPLLIAESISDIDKIEASIRQRLSRQGR